MKILGLSSNYHDASAALMVENRIVASSAEERFTLNKHDPNLPIHAAKFCLRQGGISAEDLDLIVYHEDPFVKLSRSLSASFCGFPKSLGLFVSSMKEMMKHGFWIKNEISKHLDVHPRKIQFVPHHASHACYAFLLSGFEESLILTVDAVGEWTSSGIFKASRKGGKLQIDPLELFPFPNSLGLAYSAVTAFLGFKVNDGEASTMALAAYGRPQYVEEMRKFIRPMEGGAYSVDSTYLDLRANTELPVTEKFTKAFGSPRSPTVPLPFRSFGADKSTQPSVDAQRWADIAASLQLVLEDSILGLAKRAKGKAPQLHNICLAGGVALNCVANQRLLSAEIFKNVFVPPDPGDGGASLGAALYGSALSQCDPKIGLDFSPYLGAQHDVAPALALIEHLPSTLGLKITVEKNRTETILRTARLLADGAIVGWFQGRFEHGPRALGNRSLLIDPKNIQAALRLSERVKLRASFRPYACSMTSDYAAISLSQKSMDHRSQYRWMLFAPLVDPLHEERLSAALHVDKTTRVQVCSEEDNPPFYQLMREFGRINGGTEALLNTSFNESGMPLVNTPEEALMMFIRTEMDALVLNDSLIVKAANSHA